MSNHFVDDKPQELFRKLGIELGFAGQFAQPRNLGFFAAGIARRQGVFSFISADRLGDTKAFGQNVEMAKRRLRFFRVLRLDIVTCSRYSLPSAFSRRRLFPSLPGDTSPKTDAFASCKSEYSGLKRR